LIMPVAVYLRVSTDEQRERQSINTQRDFAERYCALHSLTVYRVYADDGVTGTIPLEKRPEGSQILHDARLGKFDQLLIYKLDRLGRETRLILNAVAELEKLGVRVRSMTEEFDTGSSTGRLMLTLLSGFAAHERDTIRERSVAGILRVAQAGVWLGGIVPYGYLRVGEKRDARLVVSDDPIPGMAMSEADVIRDVFRMSAVERKSCRVIATRLNNLRIPCAYTRDDRLAARGKRRERTSGMWRAGRVRGLVTNKTYMGIHEFGKRTKSGRPPIARPVPAIVAEKDWKKAQANLKAHMLFGVRSAKNEYLLRGLIKCGLCGLTYIGTASNRDDRPGANREFYYRCNGHAFPVGLPDTRPQVPIKGDTRRRIGAAGLVRHRDVPAPSGSGAPATAFSAGVGREGRGENKAADHPAGWTAGQESGRTNPGPRAVPPRTPGRQSARPADGRNRQGRGSAGAAA